MNPQEQLYEQNTDMALVLALAKHVRKRYFIDVGAEKGTFSKELLQLGFGGVLFEPYPDHLPVLQKLTEGRSARLYPTAIDDTDHDGELHIAVDGNGLPMDYFHSLHRDQSNPHASHTSSIPIRCRSLGSLAKEGIIETEVGILKIDTEGNDLKAIKGMGPVVAEVLMCEFVTPSLYPTWESSFPEALVEQAMSQGYEECIAIKRFGSLEIISFHPRWFTDGQWGNLIFTSSELLALACHDLRDIEMRSEKRLVAGLAVTQRALEEKEGVIQVLAKACEERLMLINKLDADLIRLRAARKKQTKDAS